MIYISREFRIRVVRIPKSRSLCCEHFLQIQPLLGWSEAQQAGLFLAETVVPQLIIAESCSTLQAGSMLLATCERAMGVGR